MSGDVNHEVWAELSSINVNDQIEKKGRFKYLSWAWAWQQVKEYSCTSSYEVHEDMVYEDKTREVRCTVTIDGISHMMWLPVMDHQNRAIKNPDARAINDARMRCLVKAIAMHGLGHYIYAGEDVPQAYQEVEEVNEPEINPVKPVDPEPKSNDPQMTLKVQDVADNWLTFYKELSDPQKFADTVQSFQKFMNNRAEQYLSADFTQRLWDAHDTAKKGLMA